ncbi:hypothetical protein MAR_025833 [Mya arenaria]|uniref:Uncharacterized protein n=1 Tax=Mya arenaria TaxID=6604 RepID=A0ABY7ENT8_MYAAR|nr:uncharacterized protein LOC128245122 [Mya arenaria]WAR11653.1 hypothetical protein MAR_025833 [Mya arenaria]
MTSTMANLPTEDRGQGAFTDVLSKFQKIRDKHTRQNVYANIRQPTPPDTEDKPDGDPNPTSVLSGSATGRSVPSRPVDREWFGRRRFSHPSLLRLPMIRGGSVTGMTGFGRNWEKEKHQTYEFRKYRRHSLPYTPFEQELAKVYERKAKELLSENSNKIVRRRTRVRGGVGRGRGGYRAMAEEESDGWVLSGKDLHAFYTFWDRPEYMSRQRGKNGNHTS